VRVLLLDTETSGLSYAEGARVIEVACALFDCKHASVIESFSCLVRHDENGAEHVNGIPVSLLQEQGDEPGVVWCRVLELAVQADCYVAHRAEFDQSFTKSSIESMDPDWLGWENWSPSKPWVCSKTDIQYPRGLTGESLVQLALGLGLGVASAHRAMTDVDTMARVFARAAQLTSPMWLEEQMRRGMRPKKRHVALVRYEQRDVAKRAGFLWDDKRREWYKNMAPDDAAECNFRVVERA